MDPNPGAAQIVDPPPSPPPPPEWLVAARELGLQADEIVLYELMVNHLRFTHLQYVALSEQGGYTRLADLDQ